jgi:hypothetical protein
MLFLLARHLLIHVNQMINNKQSQLNPGDSVMDVRQFLLDAPETCFFTCYDLLLHTKDGSTIQIEDYSEISEVADITSGGCSLEMVAGLLALLVLLVVEIHLWTFLTWKLYWQHLMMIDRSGLMFTAQENCFHFLHFMLHYQRPLL